MSPRNINHCAVGHLHAGMGIVDILAALHAPYHPAYRRPPWWRRLRLRREPHSVQPRALEPATSMWLAPLSRHEHAEVWGLGASLQPQLEEPEEEGEGNAAAQSVQLSMLHGHGLLPPILETISPCQSIAHLGAELDEEDVRDDGEGDAAFSHCPLPADEEDSLIKPPTPRVDGTARSSRALLGRGLMPAGDEGGDGDLIGPVGARPGSATSMGAARPSLRPSSSSRRGSAMLGAAGVDAGADDLNMALRPPALALASGAGAGGPNLRTLALAVAGFRGRSQPRPRRRAASMPTLGADDAGPTAAAAASDSSAASGGAGRDSSSGDPATAAAEEHPGRVVRSVRSVLLAAAAFSNSRPRRRTVPAADLSPYVGQPSKGPGAVPPVAGGEQEAAPPGASPQGQPGDPARRLPATSPGMISLAPRTAPVLAKAAAAAAHQGAGGGEEAPPAPPAAAAAAGTLGRLARALTVSKLPQRSSLRAIAPAQADAADGGDDDVLIEGMKLSRAATQSVPDFRTLALAVASFQGSRPRRKEVAIAWQAPATDAGVGAGAPTGTVKGPPGPLAESSEQGDPPSPARSAGRPGVRFRAPSPSKDEPPQLPSQFSKAQSMALARRAGSMRVQWQSLKDGPDLRLEELLGGGGGLDGDGDAMAASKNEWQSALDGPGAGSGKRSSRQRAPDSGAGRKAVPAWHVRAKAWCKEKWHELVQVSERWSAF